MDKNKKEFQDLINTLPASDERKQWMLTELKQNGITQNLKSAITIILQEAAKGITQRQKITEEVAAKSEQDFKTAESDLSAEVSKISEDAFELSKAASKDQDEHELGKVRQTLA